MFNDICFYSEVCHLLSMCSFRLNARRFVQELFEDFKLKKVCFLTLNLEMPVDFGFIEIKWYTYFYAINVYQQRERERAL